MSLKASPPPKPMPMKDLKALATKKLGLFAMKHLPKDTSYVVGLSQSITNSKIAAASSDNSIYLYDEYLMQKGILQDKMKEVTGVRFSISNPNLVYNSCRDGSVRVWDLRNIRHPVSKFVANTDGKVKPLSCFDFNCNEQFLCAGTDIYDDNSYLLFWDFRSNKILGGYWDSHNDDITQIKFHPSKPNVMASAGMDGLVNLFDISQTDEDDALQATLNCDCSINKMQWVRQRSGEELVSCITTDEVVQIWSADEVNPRKIITRADLSQSLNDRVRIDHIIDNLMFEEKMYTCTGSSNGAGLLWNVTEEQPELISVLWKGHKDLPRVSALTKYFVVTGGEDGNVCIWRPESECPPQPEEEEDEVEEEEDEPMMVDSPDTPEKIDKHEKSIKSEKYDKDRYDKYDKDKSNKYDKDKSDKYDKDRSDKHDKDRSDKYDKDRSDKYDKDRSDKDKYDKDKYDKDKYDKDKYDKDKYDKDKRDKYDKDKYDKDKYDKDKYDKDKYDKDKYDKDKYDKDKYDKDKYDKDRYDKDRYDKDKYDKDKYDKDKYDKDKYDKDKYDKDKHDKDRSDKHDRTDKYDKDKSDRYEKDRSDRDRSDRDRPEKSDRDRYDKDRNKSDKYDKSDRDKSDRERSDKYDKSDRHEKSSRSEKTDRYDRSEKSSSSYKMSSSSKEKLSSSHNSKPYSR